MKKILYSVAVVCLGFFASCAEETFESNMPSVEGLIELSINDVKNTRATLLNSGDKDQMFTDFSEMSIVATPRVDTEIAPEAALFQDSFGSDLKMNQNHYWPAEDVTYNFFVAPKGMIDKNVITERHFKNGQFTFDYTAPNPDGDQDGKELQDLVLSHSVTKKGEKVDLTFEHALASVRFVYSTPKIAHTVSEIRVENATGFGTCRFDTEAQAPEEMMFWSFREGNLTYVQKYNNKEITIDKANQLIDDEAAIFTLIPGYSENTDKEEGVTEKVTFVIVIDGKEFPMEYDKNNLQPGKTVTIYIDDNEYTQTDGVVADKTYTYDSDSESWTLTIDSYVTGETHTVVKAKPIDVVLVVDVSGSMDETMSGKTRMKVTQDAINSFITTIAQKAATDGVNHKVSLVKFASDLNTAIGNDKFKDGRYYYNYSQIVSDWTTDYEGLKNTVNSLSAGGATYANYGMSRAEVLLNEEDILADTEASKIVVMLTDGTPGYSGWDATVANAAISKSKTLKDSGVKVWSIFVGESIRTSSNEYKYMQRLSSNYPAATEYNSNVPQTDTKYYANATDEAALNKVFETISEDIGQASVSFDSETVVKDIISSVFNIPTGANNFKVYEADCTGVDGDNFTFGTRREITNTLNPAPTFNGNTIEVTGFDYSANWVGKVNNQPRGKKLIIEVTGLKFNKTDGQKYFTNEGGSGLYATDEEGNAHFVPYPSHTVDKDHNVDKLIPSGNN